MLTCQPQWKAARPAPRFIKLKISKRSRKKVQIFSAAKIPSLLQVNHESREVALKWYRLSFVSKFNGVAMTYFDPTVDGIYAQCSDDKFGNCGARTVNSLMHKDELNRVKKLLWEGPLGYLPLVQIMKFPRVEEVILVRGKRTTQRSEITLAEMTSNIEPLWDNNKTIGDNWKVLRNLLCSFAEAIDKEMAVSLQTLKTVTRMDLAELKACQDGENCLRCI